MLPRFFTEKIELNRLQVALCVVVGMAGTRLITHRLQPFLFARQVAKGNFGWAEWLAGGALVEHDNLWANTRT